MLLQISKYNPMSLRVDASKLKKSSLLLENTTVEKTKIQEMNCYGRKSRFIELTLVDTLLT